MRVHALPSAFLLAFLLTPLSSAIYQDEAYKIDYQHALLGTPKRENTFFHRPSATSKASLLYTLSEKNVLGAVNPKDGAIVWRQLLADPTGTSKGLLKAGGNQSTVVTAVGNEVRAWDAADGRLVWSWLDTGRIQDLEVLDREKSKDVIVLSVDQGKSSITKLASLTGKKAWQISAERYGRKIIVSGRANLV
jgi:outer membrane protein assembly factor BamB